MAKRPPKPKPPSEAEFDAVVDKLECEATIFAEAVLARANGSPEIALAVIGLTTSILLTHVDPARRDYVARTYAECLMGSEALKGGYDA